MSKKYIISGGGTGGHIFPAIAIANEIKLRNTHAQILFVGALGKMEMEKVPSAGYEIIGLPIVGIQRKLTLSNLMFPFKLLKSYLMAKKIIKDFKPDVVIGVGGFASAPTLKAAISLKVPTVIQEQNAFAGLTNRWLSKNVNKICVAFDGMQQYFPSEKIVLTGNPVRKEMVDILDKKTKAIEFFKLSDNKETVLIVGGSLGALSINKAIKSFVSDFDSEKTQFVWQTGKRYYKEAKQFVDSENLTNVYVADFIYQMDLAYAISNVIISRAGAIAVAEISNVKKPSILVPYPYATDDHQTKNALALSQREAAFLLKDDRVLSDLKSQLQALLLDNNQKVKMIENLKGFEHQNAVEDIVEIIENLA